MSELDTLLESGFQEAANRETFARQIEAKIKEIPGAAALIPARRYGEPVNAEKIRASLTLRSLIEAKSPQLAVYFGLDAGVAHRSFTLAALFDQSVGAYSHRDNSLHYLCISCCRTRFGTTRANRRFQIGGAF